MSERLDKARAALEAAAEKHPGSLRDELLIIARVQADVAQAEALERIADVLEALAQRALTAQPAPFTPYPFGPAPVAQPVYSTPNHG
jgi:hypothetical protein